jgi:penicillin-binding protein 1A
VIEPRYAAMMNAMMQETLLTGTARKAELPGWQAAGKTGTSQNWRDAWFIGYTSHLVAGVWLGNDDGTPTKKTSGGNLPVEIWSRFMRDAHVGVPPEGLPLGDWRSEDAAEPAPPAPPAPVPGAPMAINKYGSPPVGRDNRPVPPAPIEGGAREKNLIEKLLGQL